MRRLATVTIDFLLFTVVVSTSRQSSSSSSSRHPPSVRKDGVVYKKESNALFARLKRPLAWTTRGGSSSSEQEEYSSSSSSVESDDDDRWMKVTAVLDIESAFFGNDASIHETKQDTEEEEEGEESELQKRNETEIESMNATKEMLLNLTFYASKPGDGSESDPDGIPHRFLTMQKGCRAKAKEAFDATVSWRNQYDINNILRRPHPQYDACKCIFPHYFPGRDPAQNIIFVQRVGVIDMEVAHKNNVSMDDLIMHYVYIVEYCWNMIEPGPPDGIMTSVIDMEGVSFEMVRNSEMMHFAKRFVKIMSCNYPSRSYKTLVINAPRWFNVGYKIFKPLLRESTREKIHIFAGGREQDDALRKYLGDSVPLELLSTTTRDDICVVEKDKSEEEEGGGGGEEDEPTPGPKSRIERELRTFCMNRLEEAGSPMNEVVA